MRGVIDRVTDGVAVILLEAGGRAYIPVEHLPPDARAGALVRLDLAVEGQANPAEVAGLIEHLRHGGQL